MRILRYRVSSVPLAFTQAAVYGETPKCISQFETVKIQLLIEPTLLTDNRRYEAILYIAGPEDDLPPGRTTTSDDQYEALFQHAIHMKPVESLTSSSRMFEFTLNDIFKDNMIIGDDNDTARFVIKLIPHGNSTYQPYHCSRSHDIKYFHTDAIQNNNKKILLANTKI